MPNFRPQPHLLWRCCSLLVLTQLFRTLALDSNFILGSEVTFGAVLKGLKIKSAPAKDREQPFPVCCMVLGPLHRWLVGLTRVASPAATGSLSGSLCTFSPKPLTSFPWVSVGIGALSISFSISPITAASSAKSSSKSGSLCCCGPCGHSPKGFSSLAAPSGHVSWGSCSAPCSGQPLLVHLVPAPRALEGPWPWVLLALPLPGAGWALTSPGRGTGPVLGLELDQESPR